MGAEAPKRPEDRAQEERLRAYEQHQREIEQRKERIIRDQGVQLASVLHARGELQDGAAIGLAVDFFAKNAAERGASQIDFSDQKELHRRLGEAEKQTFEAEARQAAQDKQRGSEADGYRIGESQQSSGPATTTPREPDRFVEDTALEQEARLNRLRYGQERSPNHYEALNDEHRRIDAEPQKQQDTPKSEPLNRAGHEAKDAEENLTKVEITDARAARLERLRGEFSDASVEVTERNRPSRDQEPNDGHSPGGPSHSM